MQSMQIIYRNEALDVRFSEKLVSRSFEVTRGQKRKKGQISVFFKSRQIIPQNEALELCFLKKLVSESFEVIRGPRGRKLRKMRR